MYIYIYMRVYVYTHICIYLSICLYPCVCSGKRRRHLGRRRGRARRRTAQPHIRSRGAYVYELTIHRISYSSDVFQRSRSRSPPLKKKRWKLANPIELSSGFDRVCQASTGFAQLAIFFTRVALSGPSISIQHSLFVVVFSFVYAPPRVPPARSPSG